MNLVIKNLLFAISLILLTGCSHSILVKPEIATNAYSNKLPYTIAILTKDINIAEKYIDEHPSGDTIVFSKNAILINGTLKNLNYVFDNVGLIKDMTIREKRINFIIKPKLSLKGIDWSSIVWPPLIAEAIIEYNIYDENNIFLLSLTGRGTGEYNEGSYRNLDFSRAYEMAFQMAMEDIIQKLRKAKIFISK